MMKCVLESAESNRRIEDGLSELKLSGHVLLFAIVHPSILHRVVYLY